MIVHDTRTRPPFLRDIIRIFHRSFLLSVADSNSSEWYRSISVNVDRTEVFSQSNEIFRSDTFTVFLSFIRMR